MRKERGREGGIRCGLVSDVAIDVLFCFRFVRVFSVFLFPPSKLKFTEMA